MTNEFHYLAQQVSRAGTSLLAECGRRMARRSARPIPRAASKQDIPHHRRPAGLRPAPRA